MSHQAAVVSVLVLTPWLASNKRGGISGNAINRAGGFGGKEIGE
jgi:hypothetical protein